MLPIGQALCTVVFEYADGAVVSIVASNYWQHASHGWKLLMISARAQWNMSSQQLDTAFFTASCGNVLWLSCEVACHAKHSQAMADDEHGKTQRGSILRWHAFAIPTPSHRTRN
jgi:hypothetical protein